jgi:hypothetical protein
VYCGTSVELQVVAVVLDEHSVMKIEVGALTKVFISNCENAWCNNPSKLLCNSCMSCNVPCVLKRIPGWLGTSLRTMF